MPPRVSISRLDEARHSTLAWQTVGCVCCIGSDACEVVNRDVLNPVKLSGVAAENW